VAPPISRRSFLAASAGTALLAACGGGSSGSSASTSSSADTTSSSAGGYELIGFFASDGLAPGIPQRLTYGIADGEGTLVTTSPVPSLDFTITDDSGKALGLPITVPAHQDGVPRPYFPVVFTPPAAGVYHVKATIQGKAIDRPVQIPASTLTPSVGQAMVPFATPTTADPKGVELLCTQSPPCPLHDITLTDALNAHTPVAFLIATPAFCQTAICGPVLDVLLAAQSEFPQVKMLHSEVYPTTAAAQPGPNQELVPVVNVYGLTFEPVLFLARPDGTIASRLDTVFDRTELRTALQQLVS
jgi:hypothetical protein